MSEVSFEELLRRLRAGDDTAAALVFERFARRLLGLARTRLGKAIRQKVDAEDVLQSVFKSFFHRHADGQYVVANWDSLWGILAVITLRKCGRQVRHFRAARRDIRREESPPAAARKEQITQWQALTREPTPEEVAQFLELVEGLMRGLDNRERQMLVLHLQGYTAPEISAQVGRTERTVHRLLAMVRQRLERERAADAEDA